MNQDHHNATLDEMKVRRAGQGWAIFRDGRRVSTIFRDASKAKTAMTYRKKRRATIVRKCMSCTAPFRSEGPHNRLCPTCRHKTEGMI